MGSDIYSDLPHWIIDEMDKLEEMGKVGETNEVSRPKIQNVPEYMGARVEFKKYYLPQLISIGPIHYGKPYVDLGKRYKSAWTAMYLKHTNQTARNLYGRIFSHGEELYEQFSEQVSEQFRKQFRDRWYSERQLAWTLVVDGCSVLLVLEKSDHSADPEEELKVSIDKLVRVHQDLLLLENQIPFQVLKLLCDDEARLRKCLHNFLQIHGIKTTGARKPDLVKEKGNDDGQEGEELKVIVEAAGDSEEEDPVHLLDYLRRAILMRDLSQINKEIKIKRKSLHLRKYRIGTIRELKAAGIRVAKDPSSNSFYPSFNNGKLQLPELNVDGSTALIYLNLIAYEMCPDFRNGLEISSNMVFLSSLIDQPEDVKELRYAGILNNELASDKEVADLFNKMDSVLVPETERFAHIRDQIHFHFESKRGKIMMLGWMGEAYNNYFRSPWTIIALIAASLGLVLSFIQTWFTVYSRGS